MSIARRLVASLNSRERGRRTIAEMRDRDPGENKCVTEHMLLGTVTSKPVVPTTILQQRVGTMVAYNHACCTVQLHCISQKEITKEEIVT